MKYPTYDIRPRTMWFGQDVVGCRNYPHVIQQVLANVSPDSDGNRYFSVELVLEPDNPMLGRNQAVSVRFNDQVLGYLPESTAAAYWPELARIAATALRPVTTARLVPGTNTYGESPDANVSLALGRPGTVVPVNAPPFESWALLPWGEGIPLLKIPGEEHGMSAYLPQTGEALVLFTLHQAFSPEGEPVIQVRLNGGPVGTVPQTSSAGLLSAVEQMQNMGLSLVVRGLVGGTRQSPQAVIYGATADQLDVDFLSFPKINPLSRLVEQGETYFVPDAWQGNTARPAPQQQPPAAASNQANPYGQVANSPQNQPWPNAQNSVQQGFVGQQFVQPQPAPQIVNNIYNNSAYAAPAPIPYGEKNIVVAYVLWLFLGFFGAHRFYLGENVGGVLQLLTVGGAGLWWMLDVALIPGLVDSANRRRY
ncbi:TM2 domain-containing protein [Corynebacterium vitaeruminis]|uniref:TM2 domain-containing protein n=1 Tax=Corynebacterium vitaeruminis TaxID=38305 RepID=UPI0023F21496|nr:TM2 domain-containing protein [Corynebacterium vitaeruminis]